jgi:uncharacterized caspase-like protein
MQEREFRILLVEHKPGWKDDILEGRIEKALSYIEQHDSCYYTLIKVETYEDAHQALSQETPYHLLITDISLGGKRKPSKQNSFKGVMLLSQAKDLNIPAIAVSNLSIKGDKFDEFFVDYEIKGFFDEADYSKELKFIDRIQKIWKTWYSHQSGKKLDEIHLKSTQIKPIPLNTPEPNMNFYALLIGVANYRHVTQLTKTTNDAQDLYDALIRNGYSPKNMNILKDGYATKDIILEQLGLLANSTGEGDTVIVFFSGHGMRIVEGSSQVEYLCPVDANLEQIKETCISSEEFTANLRKIKADRLVVFLDSCHSGGVGEPKDANLQIKKGLSEKTYNQMANGKGRVIIASCKSNEVSWEFENWENGLFTHYLLEGLNGKAANNDKEVYIMSLCDYISRNVPQQQSTQHPFIKLAAENFVIAINPEFSPKQRKTPEPNQTEIREKLLKEKEQLLGKMDLAYDRDDFQLLCRNMGVDYEDLRDNTLPLKMDRLISICQHHGKYQDLVNKVHNHPYFANQETIKTS